MSPTSSKKTTSAAPKSTTKAAPSKAKSPIKKVPSPSEVAPRAMMNPKPVMAAKSTKADDATPGLPGPELKKQELIEKVVRLSGAKKKDAKPVVEAMLEVLGEALADGREFNLQPMGKLKLNRTKETPNARIIIAKIRQSKGNHKASGDIGATIAAAAE